MFLELVDILSSFLCNDDSADLEEFLVKLMFKDSLRLSSDDE